MFLVVLRNRKRVDIDAAATRDWRRVAEHAAAQGRGRERHYQNYTLFAGSDPVIHRFERGAS